MLRAAYLFTFRKKGGTPNFKTMLVWLHALFFALHLYPKTKCSDDDSGSESGDESMRVYLVR
jgi:hypothetical protein